MTLLEIFKDNNPLELYSGDIRISCPIRELHDVTAPGEYSMFVKADIDRYHCFSCGSKGKLSSLLSTRFGVPYYKAIELVNVLDFDEDEEIKYTWEVSIEEVGDLKEYECPHILNYKPLKEIVRRKFGADVLRHFKVGSWRNEKGRLVTTVPLFQNDRLVGVGYRQKGSKIFSFNAGFGKANFLYNEPKPSGKGVILLEGFTDVWRSFQYGYHETCGKLGTALTDLQIERLIRHKKVLIGMDNDYAGILAAEKDYLKLRNKMEVLFIPYSAEDPDKTTKSEWDRGIKEAQNYAEYSMELLESYPDYEGIQKRARYEI